MSYVLQYINIYSPKITNTINDPKLNHLLLFLFIYVHDIYSTQDNF